MVGKEQLALNLELKTWTPFKSITDIQTVQTQRQSIRSSRAGKFILTESELSSSGYVGMCSGETA